MRRGRRAPGRRGGKDALAEGTACAKRWREKQELGVESRRPGQAAATEPAESLRSIGTDPGLPGSARWRLFASSNGLREGRSEMERLSWAGGEEHRPGRQGSQGRLAGRGPHDQGVRGT